MNKINTKQSIIMNELNRKYDQAISKFGKDRVVGIFLYGSQNYSTDIETSDIDCRVVLIPSILDIVNNDAQSIESNDLDNSHILYRDIRLVKKEFLKQNINSVEILFTDYFIINPKYKRYWKQLWKLREDIARYDPHRTLCATFGMLHAANSIVQKGTSYKDVAKQVSKVIYMYDFFINYQNPEIYSYKRVLRSPIPMWHKKIRTDFSINLDQAKAHCEYCEKCAKAELDGIERNSVDLHLVVRLNSIISKFILKGLR